MSIPSAPLSESQVAEALRTAGCVFAEEEARLLVSAARTPGELAEMLARRVAGEPVELVVGWASFCGLRIHVEPGVFVPRRRSEFLATTAAEFVLGARAAENGGVRQPVVLDMCCGSGAVGAAVAALSPPVQLHAADIDEVSVRCARRNLQAAGGRVYLGDMYAPLPAALRGRADVIVANAPYVPTGALDTLPAEARLYEPPTALDGGPDGLGVQRKVIAQARCWLAPGGHLLVETSERQAQRSADAVIASGLIATTRVCEELEATVVIGRNPDGSL